MGVVTREVDLVGFVGPGPEPDVAVLCIEGILGHVDRAGHLEHGGGHPLHTAIIMHHGIGVRQNLRGVFILINTVYMAGKG